MGEVYTENLDDPEAALFYSLALLASADPRDKSYALERRQWREASELELMNPGFAWKEFGWAQSIHHFARAIGAARSDQIERARQELAAIEAFQRELPATTLPYWQEEVQVHVDTVRSWILLAEGKNSGALEQYRIVLRGSPNRLNALLGAASAAAESDEAELADHYYTTVREQTRAGNRDRVGLAQAWATSP